MSDEECKHEELEHVEGGYYRCTSCHVLFHFETEEDLKAAGYDEIDVEGEQNDRSKSSQCRFVFMYETSETF